MNRYYSEPHWVRRWLLALFLFVPAAPAVPLAVQESAAEIDVPEQQRQQERARALRRQNQSDQDIRLARPSAVLPYYPLGERPCRA